MTTPTLIFCGLLFLSSALAEAKRYSADAAQSALDRRQQEIQQNVSELQRKLQYLRQRGLACTSYPKQVKELFLDPMERKHLGYQQVILSEISKVKSGVKSRPDAFASVDACEGYKNAAVADFESKKTVISRARAAIKVNVERPAETDLRKLYKESLSALMGKTPFQALTSAFEKTPSVPNCPSDALRVFHSVAHLKNNSADLNEFVKRVETLDQLLDDYGDSLRSMIRDIEKIRCETSVAEAPKAKEKKEELKPKPEPKAEPKAQEKPKQAQPETKQGGFNGLRNGQGPTEIPPGDSVAKPRAAPVSAEPEEPAPISESDRWGKPKSWKEYDQYKAAVGAPNKVTGVDLQANYSNFLSTNGIEVRNADDALRLQKAINQTSMQVGGPDSFGPSVYQDGVVGSRTKSAIYLMQNDPYYRDALIQNLKRQGLIR